MQFLHNFWFKELPPRQRAGLPQTKGMVGPARGLGVNPDRVPDPPCPRSEVNPALGIRWVVPILT